MDELDQFINDLDQGFSLWDGGTLVGALLVAYGVCWLIGRRRPADSVWFGRALVDGVLFPLLALGLTYSARIILDDFYRVPLLRMAVPVLLALAGIRLLARVFMLAFPRSALARLVERVFSWVAWIATALWILGLLPAVMAEMDSIQFAFGKSRISVLGIVQGVLSSGVVLVLALWVSAAFERKVLRENIQDLSLRKVAGNAVRAILLLVGFLFALSAVGVDLTALSVLGGAVGVGLGFGLQKLAANYVSGFVILFERSLRIGDTVRVDGFEGVVADIKTRYTLIRAGNGRESIVPNEKLITERIENLSLDDPRLLLTTAVAVGYDSDVDQAEQLLVAAALGTTGVLAEPAPAARLMRFGADGLEYELTYWISNPQGGQNKVRSDVNVAVLKSLRRAGIDIPYPQRVLRIEGPVAIAGPAPAVAPVAS
jgi:small-conductance mechanosensitive channel